MKLNTDLLKSADVKRVAQLAMSILDRVQDHKAHERMLAAAAVTLTLCEVYRLDRQDLMTAVNNIMNFAEGRRPEFKAVRLHAENED